MNYPANNPAIFRRDGTGRPLTAGALACTLALLLSTALSSPALADPGSAQLARATPAAARTTLPQVSARAAQDRRT